MTQIERYNLVDKWYGDDHVERELEPSGDGDYVTFEDYPKVVDVLRLEILELEQYCKDITATAIIDKIISERQ